MQTTTHTHGNSTAILGDCMDYMRSLPDKAFDLAIVDPPYGIGVSKMAYTQADGRCCVQRNGNKLKVNKTKYAHKDWDDCGPSEEYFNELFRVSENQIIWGVNYFPYSFLVGGRIVWDKLNGDNSFSDCEIAYCSFHSNMKMFRYMWSGMCQGKSVKEGNIQRGNKKLNEIRIHPTQKPIDLYAWLLTRYAQPSHRILDTHLGSGSSRIAAYQLGFEFVGIEIDEQYFAAQNERFERECLGIITTADGTKYVQQNLFG